MKTWALRDDATLQAVQAVPFQKAMQAVDCLSSASGIEAGLAAFHRLSYGLLQSNALSPCGCLFTSLLICSSLDLETGESLSFTLSTSYLFFN